MGGGRAEIVTMTMMISPTNDPLTAESLVTANGIGALAVSRAGAAVDGGALPIGGGWTAQ